jgi:GTP cyclohydrolase I
LVYVWRILNGNYQFKTTNCGTYCNLERYKRKSSKIKERAAKLDQTKKYFGVPRGGQYIAALINPVDTLDECDVIIDDLIDSGATRFKYEGSGKEFVALYDKQKEQTLKNKWLVFPWELKEENPVEENVSRLLQYFGEDVNREGLQDTPRRYIKFLTQFLEEKKFNFTCFDSEGYDEMISQTNIPFYSLCEHHMAPFFGTASVAYIPDKKIVGLSKLARTIDFFSNRFQNQERITMQVAQFLEDKLNPKGVAVVIKAKHLCMEMRGVKKHDTYTTTSRMVGFFKDHMETRMEFLKLID